MFWLVLILIAVLIVPIVLANWIASRVYPFPSEHVGAESSWAIVEKRATLATWLTGGFLAVIVAIALVAR